MIYYDPYDEKKWESPAHLASDLEQRLEERDDPESSEGAFLLEGDLYEDDENCDFINIKQLWRLMSECIYHGKGRSNNPEEFDDPSYFEVTIEQVCPHCQELDMTCGETSHNVPKVYNLKPYLDKIERCEKCKR